MYNSIGLLKPDQGYMQSPAESLKILMETHFPQCRLSTSSGTFMQVNGLNIDFLDSKQGQEIL
uniref:Uncharacterized protein n=1 Tax=Lepeophtheirus salmonis TaxID=72036 RepID=A0A0K2TU99_LEPSM